MRKVVIHRRGGYEQLRIEEHASAPLGPADVRIAVEAAGVNYADCIVRMGLYQSAKDYVGWPITPGFEVAGTVVEVGDSAQVDRREGDRVIAVTRFGGYADEVVVPATHVFDLPRGFSAADGAGFCTAHLTAHYAAELADAARGDGVLVHSAAGGVGLALVRLCRYLGCRVVGVVGATHKVEHARAAGATAVIDTSVEDLWDAAERHCPGGYAAIFDANGVSTLRQSYRHVGPTGRLVVYGFASMLPRAGERLRWLRLAWDWLRTPRFDPFALTHDNRSVMGFNLSYLFGEVDRLRATMDELLGLAEAHRDLESGRTVGKLVLVP